MSELFALVQQLKNERIFRNTDTISMTGEYGQCVGELDARVGHHMTPNRKERNPRMVEGYENTNKAPKISFGAHDCAVNLFV